MTEGLRGCLRIAALQMNSGDSVAENLATIRSLIDEAKAGGAELAVLPENALQMPTSNASRYVEPWAGDEATAPVQAALRAISMEANLTLVVGSLAVNIGGEKPVARSYVVSPSGEIVGFYDKLHLFDVITTSQQQTIRYAESDDFSPGSIEQAGRSSTAVVQLNVNGITFNLGLTICYDLRFPEWFRVLQAEGADVVTVPSAFTYETGQMHWRPLLRARAIENQLFLIAPNQCGTHQRKPAQAPRKTWGHSMVVDPEGRVLSELEGEPGVLLQDLDFDFQSECQRRFPVTQHRRL